MSEPITLNHIESLRKIINDYPEHFINFDLTDLDRYLEKLSDKQYKYILFLISSKHWFKAKEIIKNTGLPDREDENYFANK